MKTKAMTRKKMVADILEEEVAAFMDDCKFQVIWDFLHDGVRGIKDLSDDEVVAEWNSMFSEERGHRARIR